MTINRPNSNNIGCNTAKCSSCNMRLVCASSPFVLINNSSDDSNNAKFAQRIAELEELIVRYIDNEAKLIQNLSQNLSDINKNVEAVSEIVIDLAEKVEKSTSNRNNNASLFDTDVSEQLYSAFGQDSVNQVVPYDETQKVLVEKKGLFGKTKWVEEKKK